MPIIPFVGSEFSEAGIPEKVLEKLQRIHMMRRKGVQQMAAATLSDAIELYQDATKTYNALGPAIERESLKANDSMPVEPHIAKAYDERRKGDGIPFRDVKVAQNDEKGSEAPEPGM